MRKDIQSPTVIKLKAALFLVVVMLASSLLILRSPELSTVLLLGLALWAAARAYYFAFYVLHHYVDPTFRYSGLGSLVGYLLANRQRRQRPQGPAV